MRWLRRILAIIAMFAVLAGVALLGFMGISLYAFSQMEANGGFMMIPQDCILLERDINGRVQAQNGQPIVDAKLHIYTHDFRGFEAGKVDLNLTTDNTGRFNADDVDIFACDTVVFEITTTGYSTKKIEFIAAQKQINSVGDQENYGDPDFTTALAYGQTPVLPRQITIELP